MLPQTHIPRFKQYNGAIDAAKKTLATEGITGMYRGMWPNLSMYSQLYQTIADLTSINSQGSPGHGNVLLRLRDSQSTGAMVIIA